MLQYYYMQPDMPMSSSVCLRVQVNQSAISQDGHTVLQGLGNGHIAVSTWLLLVHVSC